MRRQHRLPLLEAARPALTHSAYAVYDLIARMALPDGTLRWPLGNAQLVRETGYSERTISRARRELVDRGLVEVVGGGVHHDRLEVRLVLPAASTQEVRQAAGYPQASAPMSTRSGHRVYPAPLIDPRACTDPTGYQLHPSPTASPRESCRRHPDKPGKACRACGTSPRQQAANPRASGSNPRAGYVTPIPDRYAATPRGSSAPPGLLDGLREQLQRTLTERRSA